MKKKNIHKLAVIEATEEFFNWTLDPSFPLLGHHVPWLKSLFLQTSMFSKLHTTRCSPAHGVSSFLFIREDLSQQLY